MVSVKIVISGSFFGVFLINSLHNKSYLVNLCNGSAKSSTKPIGFVFANGLNESYFFL